MQSYQGQLSGAVSGTSSAGTSGGQRGTKMEVEKKAEHSDEPASHSPVCNYARMHVSLSWTWKSPDIREVDLGAIQTQPYYTAPKMRE
jgi:hypothetical protein